MIATDTIEKTITLNAPRSRVWRAISDSSEFAKWFGFQLDGPFVAGRTNVARLASPKYAGVTVEMKIERIEPETLFAYRWHPFALDTTVDYSAEPMTLVEFRLSDAPNGTLLEITESGFDGIPEHRRDAAFRANEGGWKGQAENIRKYVEGHVAS